MVLRMEISACPNCGSKNIGIGTLGDGIISGLSSWKEVCRNCGYQGASLVFESETDYQRFLDALHQQKKQQEGQREGANEDNQGQETDEQTKENEKILELLDETDHASQLPEKKNYTFEFILSVILTIIFFIILFGSSLLSIHTGIFSQNDFSSIVLYILGSFFGVLIFFFLLIVFIEMIYRSIRARKK